MTTGRSSPAITPNHRLSGFRLRWRKSQERKAIGAHAGGDERGEDRGGAGDRLDADSARERLADQALAGVGDDRRTGVRHDRK